jgi:hypothetical protein
MWMKLVKKTVRERTHAPFQILDLVQGSICFRARVSYGDKC